jgi:hypothetical protein
LEQQPAIKLQAPIIPNQYRVLIPVKTGGCLYHTPREITRKGDKKTEMANK